MYLQTKEISPEGLTIDRRFAHRLPAAAEETEAVSIGEVHLTGDLHKTRDGIDFRGDIETIATISCSRCLEPYPLPLELHFRLLYTTDPEEESRRERRLDDETVTRVRYDGVRIDLGRLLEEQVYLGLPLKPLCRPDCRGLCSHCGANLNATTCDCNEHQDEGERAEDPRLTKLKTLL